MNLEEIKLLITEAKENTVVILQCPNDHIDSISSEINAFKKSLKEKKILFITCSSDYKITVVPPGNNIKQIVE